MIVLYNIFVINYILFIVIFLGAHISCKRNLLLVYSWIAVAVAFI